MKELKVGDRVSVSGYVLYHNALKRDPVFLIKAKGSVTVSPCPDGSMGVSLDPVHARANCNGNGTLVNVHRAQVRKLSVKFYPSFETNLGQKICELRYFKNATLGAGHYIKFLSTSDDLGPIHARLLSKWLKKAARFMENERNINESNEHNINESLE